MRDAMRMAASCSVGRVALHLAAMSVDREASFHLAGIGRELSGLAYWLAAVAITITVGYCAAQGF